MTEPSRPLKRFSSIPIEWVGWAAGLYEGEGTIGFTNDSACVSLSISQNDYLNEPSWVLTQLQDLFGGYIRSKATDHQKWVCSAENLRDFLFLIEPFLSPRRLHKLAELRAIAKERTLTVRAGPRTFWWKLEEEDEEGYDYDESGLCSIDDCSKPVQGRGWCATHYGRWFRTGSAASDIPIRNYTK